MKKNKNKGFRKLVSDFLKLLEQKLYPSSTQDDQRELIKQENVSPPTIGVLLISQLHSLLIEVRRAPDDSSNNESTAAILVLQDALVNLYPDMEEAIKDLIAKNKEIQHFIFPYGYDHDISAGYTAACLNDVNCNADYKCDMFAKGKGAIRPCNDFPIGSPDLVAVMEAYLSIRNDLYKQIIG